MNGIIDQATAATILYILDHLPGLPPDRASQEAFFSDVPRAYAAVVAEVARNQIAEPSQN
jgi:hypothetical protein